jgi:hypothetical protein
MNAEQVRRIIRRNRDSIAFLLGNGINRYYTPSNLSWNELLLTLWSEYTFRTKSVIPKGLSFTEFYDLLEIENYDKPDFSLAVQKHVQELLLKWQPNTEQNLVLESIRDMNTPILTTNFDDLIPRSMKLDFYNMKGKDFTDFYPWSCYYAKEELNVPSDGFGVWYVNGMAKYHRSIKLGLAQYIGGISRARRMILADRKIMASRDKGKSEWEGLRTWLQIFFNKALFIFGLGLEESEIFLRWLIIERAKYFRQFPRRKRKGWYLVAEEAPDGANEGRSFFLESCGFEVLRVKTYKTMYEEIWK